MVSRSHAIAVGEELSKHQINPQPSRSGSGALGTGAALPATRLAAGAPLDPAPDRRGCRHARHPRLPGGRLAVRRRRAARADPGPDGAGRKLRHQQPRHHPQQGQRQHPRHAVQALPRQRDQQPRDKSLAQLQRAPFGGVVTTKNAQPGEMISPMSVGGFTRTGICTIVDMKSLEIEMPCRMAFSTIGWRIRFGTSASATATRAGFVDRSAATTVAANLAPRSRTRDRSIPRIPCPPRHGCSDRQARCARGRGAAAAHRSRRRRPPRPRARDAWP